MNQRDDFRKSIERDSSRQHKAEHEPAGLFGLMLYGGTLGLLFIIPIVAGAYFGRWLDSTNPEFDTRWTISFILLGLATGFWNVFWYIREHS